MTSEEENNQKKKETNLFPNFEQDLRLNPIDD
jgi:hypothetical protein